MAAGWPACLRIVAAVASIVKDANKLILGQDLVVTAPHVLESVWQLLDCWLTNIRMTHYQTLLLNSDRITFSLSASLNPATLLLGPELESPIHDCQQKLAEACGWRKDLSDQPLTNAEVYTDWSSFLGNGQRRAGAAMVDGQRTIWVQSLPKGTVAQKAEWIVLTKVLELAEGKRANIYTDSRYVFATTGAIYQQRGLLMSGGKEIKNKIEILALLKALLLPTKVSITHCPGHQKGDSPVARGNNMADEAAQEAARQAPFILAVQTAPSRKKGHEYTAEDSP